MQTVVIVIHLMVVVALIAVVLLQRSEGGALGIGGSDQFMSVRGQGNVLTRATTILAAVFFATSMLMTVLNRLNAPPTSILDTTPAAQQTAPTTTPSTTTPNAHDNDAGDRHRHAGGWRQRHPRPVEQVHQRPDDNDALDHRARHRRPGGAGNRPAGPDLAVTPA